METNEKITFIRNTVLDHFPTTQGVNLFGTYLTEDEWPNSDVDPALLLPRNQAKREGNLALSIDRLIFTGDEYAVQEFEILTFSYYQKLNDERREILEAFEADGRAYNI